jgi:hypothetical protein
MLRFAADQAWEHAKTMTAMAEQFLSDKTAVSTLWPIVGYGSYVCAAIQMRRLLALNGLNRQHLDRIKIHLHITGELKKYGMPLEPLVCFPSSFSLSEVFSLTIC